MVARGAGAGRVAGDQPRRNRRTPAGTGDFTIPGGSWEADFPIEGGSWEADSFSALPEASPDRDGRSHSERPCSRTRAAGTGPGGASRAPANALRERGRSPDTSVTPGRERNDGAASR